MRMLHPMRVRLCEADRKQYAIETEWLPLNQGLFMKHRASVLADWEKQTGIKILDFVAGDSDIRSMAFLKTTYWLACKVNGVEVPQFAEFDPYVLDGDIESGGDEPEGDDVDPPSSS